MHYWRKPQVFFILLLFIEFSSGRKIYTTLSTGQILKDGDSLISANKVFTLGFFSPGISSNNYLGISYNLQGKRVVWVANRNKPVNDSSSGVLSFHTPNKLVIYGSDLKVPLWTTGFLGPGKNYSAQLLDTGNLIVFEENKKEVIAWQSFDHPADIWLPSMKFGFNRKTRSNSLLTSWKSEADPEIGRYSFRMDVIGDFSELALYVGSNRKWRMGPLGGARLNQISSMPSFNGTYVDNEDRVYMTYSVPAGSTFSVIAMAWTGLLTMSVWKPSQLNWTNVWTFPGGPCESYNLCGPNKYCALVDRGINLSCQCLPGFEPNKGAEPEGCVRKRGGKVCQNGEGFAELSSMKLPDTKMARVDLKRGMKECKEECLRDCLCTAYANASDMGFPCVMWYGNLLDTIKYGRFESYETGERNLYVRVDAIELELIKRQGQRSSSSKMRLNIYGAVPPLVGAAVFLLLYLICLKIYQKRRALRSRAEQGPANKWTKELFDANETRGNIQFIDLITLIEATNNFCDENKLGRGGFGTVYKGTLKDGYVIAVKRLSATSQQGVAEFKNEATLVSRLQHMNLVRLLGCCAEQNEKMLIYEYMPNKSLNSLIFDPEKSSCLDWEKRFNIIIGITRGMMYLHNESRVKIIHRDLKASNILLDAQMNPKVSDFGMARFFDNNEVEAITTTVVGTYGYMSPEYIVRGIYSEKSDVYSFGVLLLEIVSGKKNNTYINEETLNLIDLAWNLMGRALEIVDSSMGDYPATTVQRCIHVGLLCVQRNPDHRPTMSEIFVMLSNENTDLPTPQPPGIVHCPPPPGHSTSSDYTLSNDYTSSADYMPSSNNESLNDLTCSEIIPR